VRDTFCVTLSLSLSLALSGHWSDQLIMSLKDATADLALVGSTLKVYVKAREETSEALLLLLRIIVDNVEGLIEDWFHVHVDTFVPCVHCIMTKPNEDPQMFALAEVSNEFLLYVLS